MSGRGISGLVCAALWLAGCGGSAPAPTEAEIANMTPDEAAEAEQSALARCGEVSVEGYCGVKFGQAVAEAEKAFPVKLEGVEMAAGAPLPPGGCYELFAAQPVRGISFLVESGIIGRVDVITEIARTPEGFGVGTQASAIRTRYGDALHVNVNDLEPEIIDLSITEGAVKFVYEIQDGVVRAWRAGLAPSIDYVAHCSGH